MKYFTPQFATENWTSQRRLTPREDVLRSRRLAVFWFGSVILIVTSTSTALYMSDLAVNNEVPQTNLNGPIAPAKLSRSQIDSAGQLWRN
jgi:hypothetical protein